MKFAFKKIGLAIVFTYLIYFSYSFSSGYIFAYSLSYEGIVVSTKENEKNPGVNYYLRDRRFVPSIMTNYASRNSSKIEKYQSQFRLRPFHFGVWFFNRLKNDDLLKKDLVKSFPYRYLPNFYGPILTPDTFLSTPKSSWGQLIFSYVYFKWAQAQLGLFDFVEGPLKQESPTMRNVFCVFHTGKELNEKGFSRFFDLRLQPLLFESSIEAYKFFDETKIARALEAGWKMYLIKKPEFEKIGSRKEEEEFISNFEEEIKKLCESISGGNRDFEIPEKLEPYIEKNINKILY